MRALSLSSWKAIWQMILWPRSPQAQAGEADVPDPVGPRRLRLDDERRGEETARDRGHESAAF